MRAQPRNEKRKTVPSPLLTQISARVPDELKHRFDALVARKGLRKEYVVEEALRHHLQVLEEIPAEYIIPLKIVFTTASAERFVELVENPPEPTDALKKLLAGEINDGDY